MPDPYNRKLHRVGFNPEETKAMVFWTSWLAPFFSCLDRVFGDGVPFVIQYIPTGLGEEIEPGVSDLAARRGDMHRAATATARAGWLGASIRSCCGEDGGLARTILPCFAAIAEAVQGAADEAIVSFAQFYGKIRSNVRHRQARAEAPDLPVPCPQSQLRQQEYAPLSRSVPLKPTVEAIRQGHMRFRTFVVWWSPYSSERFDRGFLPGLSWNAISRLLGVSWTPAEIDGRHWLPH